jgi:hypothetical protein
MEKITMKQEFEFYDFEVNNNLLSNVFLMNQKLIED